MLFNRILLSGKRKYLFALMLLMLVSVIYVAFGMEDGAGFNISRREVLLRRIGHEILLQAGDSTSRVLPVKKIAENEYQIAFEKHLTFQPDSLVNTTRRLLAKDPLTRDYVVNVLNCTNAGVAYGYAISKNKKDDIVACGGRKQPTGCYMINIKFEPTGMSTADKGYLLGGLSVFAFIGFMLFKPAKNRGSVPSGQPAGMFSLGPVLFDAKSRRLIIYNKATGLTGTETRVLTIFALSPNETIERSRLQKEIWEDEGVIVGRSLDMFISKLRKKLEADAAIKIVNVRGKGYKLEVNA